MQSEQVNELFEALSKAQLEMTGGRATKHNPFLKNKYATLEDIWAEIREPFADNGLSVVQAPHFIEGKHFLVTVLGHKSGQWIKSFIPLAMSPSPKNAMQELGASITYARRYGLMSISGFSMCDATDNDAEECHKSKFEQVDIEQADLSPQEVTYLRSLCEIDSDFKRRLMASLGKTPIESCPRKVYNSAIMAWNQQQSKQEKTA